MNTVCQELRKKYLVYPKMRNKRKMKQCKSEFFFFRKILKWLNDTDNINKDEQLAST